jgi:uncharacterized protein (DUF2236 family)
VLVGSVRGWMVRRRGRSYDEEAGRHVYGLGRVSESNVAMRYMESRLGGRGTGMGRLSGREEGLNMAATAPAGRSPPVTSQARSDRPGPSDFDVRDLIDGAALLASTANVVMQLARPAVGYGVLESAVESGQMMRHPLRRTRNTITYLSVAFMGTAEERSFCRRQVNRSHAQVRSEADSPVCYRAFDPRLQLWVAACLCRGCLDVYTMLHGPVDEAVADAICRECRTLGTTLQVPEDMWPADRTAFERYWAAAVAEVRIDPPVRDYLDRLMTLDYLPRPFSMAFGPVNRFLTVGFLPPPFREQMQVRWTESDQHAFAFLVGMVALADRLLPGPVSRFPFNACLQDLRIRRFVRARFGIGRNRWT